jgi:hypothetical protein
MDKTYSIFRLFTQSDVSVCFLYRGFFFKIICDYCAKYAPIYMRKVEFKAFLESKIEEFWYEKY